MQLSESNNFINNTNQITINDDYTHYLNASGIDVADSKFAPVNFWDDGKEGNYWSNYTGTDDDGDDIGNEPYVIDKNNQDNHPLMSKVVIPEFPDDEKRAVFDLTLVAIVVVIELAVVVGILLYRLKSGKT